MDTNFDTYQAQMIELEGGPRSVKFYLGSFVIHLSLLASSLLVSELMPPPEMKDLIEISVQDFAQKPTESPAPAAPEKVVEKTVVKALPKSIAKAQRQQKEESITEPKIVVKKIDTPVATKNSVLAEKEIEDTESTLTKQLMAGPAAPAPVENISDNDLDEDLDKVDQEHTAHISKLKNEIDESSQKLLSQQEEDINTLKQQTSKKSDALAKHLAQMKSEDEARVKGALASEIAARNAAAARAAQAEAAARSAAERAAAGRAAQAAAEKAAADQLARDLAFGNSLGVDVPVKALQDLKQMPGNARPLYDSDDRLASRQGEVAFLAYVELDGRVSKFKLLKSTGHRALDAKTYAAIRSWKFYPGQEGWVEIPFKWDLKGGAQEMTATLRRSVSQK